MNKETRERRLQRFINWRKAKMEEMELIKSFDTGKVPDSFLEEYENKERRKTLADFRKLADKILDENKDLIKALHRFISKELISV